MHTHQYSHVVSVVLVTSFKFQSIKYEIPGNMATIFPLGGKRNFNFKVSV